MGRRRLSEWQDAVDENSEGPRSGQLERAFQVFSALGAQSADDPKTLLIEAPHVEGDESPAMSADGHEPASRRETVERARPEGRIGDVLEDRVSSAASRDPHDLAREILSAVVHSEIGAQRHGELDTLVRPGGRDRMSPQALRDLYQAAAQATGCAHDQRPVVCLEIGQMALAEGQREMPRDDRRMSEGEPFGKRHAVDGGYLQVLRVSTPALDPEHLSTRTAALVASRAVLAATAPDTSEDGHAVADLRHLDLGAHRGNDPRRVVAQDERQGHSVVAAVLPHLEIERPVDGYGVNPEEDLARPRGRRLNVLPSQDIGTTEFPDDDGFQRSSPAPPGGRCPASGRAEIRRLPEALAERPPAPEPRRKAQPPRLSGPVAGRPGAGGPSCRCAHTPRRAPRATGRDGDWRASAAEPARSPGRHDRVDDAAP